MHTKQQLSLAFGLALGLHNPLIAREKAAPVQAAPSNPGNWCDWQDSVIYYANAGYKVNDELSVAADFIYNTPDGDFDALTYLIALRTYF